MVRKRTRAAAKVPPKRREGNFVRHWRLFRGYATQDVLAEKSGVTRVTISRLESGALPYRQSVLEKLAAALDCTPGDLIERDPQSTITIVQIYSRLSERDQGRAIKMLKTLTDDA
jgi:transcriptional regulator with XRE-family HTH domain